MEDIMNEPTENGLAAVMGEFWQSLSDLSVYPENEGLERSFYNVDKRSLKRFIT